MLLLRTDTSDQGTFGILVFGDEFVYTGELPWRENKPNLSCIPEGRYTMRLRVSPRYGRVFEIGDVPDRSYILLHQGNFCGDTSLGYRTNVRGCVLLGIKRGSLGGQKAVLSSRMARRRFETALNFQPTTLEIRAC